MTILDLRCQNKDCPGFGQPLSEVWTKHDDGKIITKYVFCDSCHYVEGAVPHRVTNVVSSSMNEAWVTPKRKDFFAAGGWLSRHFFSVALGVAMIIVSFVAGLLIVSEGDGVAEREIIEVDGGVRCIRNMSTDEIESCDWLPR